MSDKVIRAYEAGLITLEEARADLKVLGVDMGIFTKV